VNRFCYKLWQSLPEPLKGSLPSIEEIEAELEKECTSKASLELQEEQGR
jgi:hypothetical protein